MTTRALIARLELAGARAWPAAETADLNGWLLRATYNVTRRANSVLPLTAHGSMPLFTRIEEAERFYRERGLPPRFQVSPAMEPPDLERALVARGYRSVLPIRVQSAPLAPLLRTRARPDLSVSTTPELHVGWMDTYARAEGMADREREVRADILRRIGERTLFAHASLEGTMAGVGLGVIDGRWLGIFCMATVPAFRRQGVGIAVLAALAAAARPHVSRVYLQVHSGNIAAERLYAAVGFRELYRYRVLEHSM